MTERARIKNVLEKKKLGTAKRQEQLEYKQTENKNNSSHHPE
jgi:hypothetical protein